MLYLRTASGTFINAAEIVSLSPYRDDDGEEITGWIATCTDGKTVVLAAYYAEPGRLDHAIRFMPAIEIGSAGTSAS